LDPMVILVHVLRRYLLEIAKKPKFVVDEFFQRTRADINRSINPIKGKEDLATFTKFVELLKNKHAGLLRGIASSSRMRESERRAFKMIYQFGGTDPEIQQLLKMLNGIKKDEAFRKRIDKLINLTSINQPVSAVTPRKFSIYLWGMRQKSDFNRLISYIFEKAMTSQRMAKLMATVFLALDEKEDDPVLKEILPGLLSIDNHREGFVKTYAAIFLVRDPAEDELSHIRRISRLFRQELKGGIFLKQFNMLAPIKLKPAGHPLANMLKTQIKNSPDFLHLLTQGIFVDSPGDILPRIPLDLVRRGLVAIYSYSGKQADDYLSKFISSITFYYQKHLPKGKKDKPHFYLMISALSKYVHELLDAVYQKKIFRDSEVDTWMPLLDAIRSFNKIEDKDQKLVEIWDILVPIREKKEVRDQLTLMNKLTNVSSAAYFKDFIPYVKKLSTDKAQFKQIFNHLFEQACLDREHFESTVKWHTNLLNNMIRYLSDISITSDRDTLPILNHLVLGWLYIFKTYLYDLINLLSQENLTTIRNLINYLYTHFPETLIKVIQSLIRLDDEGRKDNAAGFIQFIHTALLEQARVPGMMPKDTQREIDNIKQLFDECCKDIGEHNQHYEKFIFSDAYKMSISNLLTVEVREEEEELDVGMRPSSSNLPPLIVSLINQSTKIFNIPNFATRAVSSFSEILDWAIEEMKDHPRDSGSLLENISRLYRLFTEKYRFSAVSSSSIIHNFAYKNEFDHFSFSFVAYAVAKALDWDEILFRNAWRDITITVNIGSEDLELKKNAIVNSTAMINTKSRFFKDLDRLFAPLKAETAVETFFHLKNGIALADTRRYRLATISLEKALALHKTNIYAHYWRAMALKKAKINLEQYENHISVIERYYPNSNEIESLKKTDF